MRNSFWTVFLAALVVMPMIAFGCKGKVDKSQENVPPVMAENQGMYDPSTFENIAVTEPSQVIPAETIPPTATPEIIYAPPVVASGANTRSQDIQRSLKNAGFYAGPIDGKIGPKTKKAIEDFQRQKRLKVDGKVGPKTWGELEKYLIQ